MTDRPLHMLGLALLTLALVSAGPGDKSTEETKSSEKKSNPKSPVSQARQRARLLQDLYETTSLAMHRHYFEPDKRRAIPSRAMEDIFYRINRRWNVKARWLAGWQLQI